MAVTPKKSAGITRIEGKRRFTPQTTGTRDPRPLTTYEIEVDEVGSDTLVSVKLDQPCIIRNPKWAFINCKDGSTVLANVLTIDNNMQFTFKFTGGLNESVAFVQVPYQDMEVQNFQGGFVSPGGQWFREPIMP